MLRMRLFVAAVAAVAASLALFTQLAVAEPASAGGQAKAATGRAAPTVSIKTSAGEIVVELDSAKAPKTVDNFLQYVKTGFYKIGRAHV